MTDLSELTSVFENATNVTIVLNSVANQMDNVMRFLSLFVHLVYVGFICVFRDFRTRQMLYLNHVNLVSLIYCLHYACYITTQTPNFNSQALNNILCYISSMVWLVSKFLRMYSLLLLAFYRYTAVFHMQFYRVLSGSWFYMTLGIALIWIYSIAGSFMLKYTYQTRYSIFYCFEGDSNDINIVISFLIVNNFFAIAIPSLLVFFFYIRIMQRINELTNKLSPQEQLVKTISTAMKTTQVTSTTSDPPKLKRRKQFNIALQLIFINSVNIIGSVFSILIETRLKLATTNDVSSLTSLQDNQYERPIFRFVFLLTQSLIPISSIVLSSWNK